VNRLTVLSAFLKTAYTTSLAFLVFMGDILNNKLTGNAQVYSIT